MRHIFLTGGTGVIGSALIPQLLSYPDVQVTALIRAKSHDPSVSDDDILTERAEELLSFCGIADSEERQRIHFVRGDVCAERMGLTKEQYGELQESVTAIIHSAGNVKLNQSIEVARRNAVAPVKEILKLARSTQCLQKLDAVSTIGVAGRMPGLIPERRLVEPRKFHNNYERAKSEAEELLWDAMDEGLPITIHRPSMVVGDSRNGAVAHYQVFYYLCDFMSGNQTFGIVPDLENAMLDIVPCDYVASAICSSCIEAACSGMVFHLCAGTTPELLIPCICREVRRIYQSHGIVCKKLRTVSKHTFGLFTSAAKLLGNKSVRRSANNLIYFTPYLDSRHVFSVTRTPQRARHNRLVDKSLNDYLPHVLAPYLTRTTRSIPTRFGKLKQHDLMPT